MAKSDLITNGNLDDRSSNKALEINLQALTNNPDIDLVYSGYYYTEKPNETFEKNSYRWIVEPQEFASDRMFQYLPGPQPMWRKSMHEKYGFFDETFTSSGNWEMWLRAVSQGSKFKKVPGIHTLYYSNPNGISTNPEPDKVAQRSRETDLIVNKYKFLWDGSTSSARVEEKAVRPEKQESKLVLAEQETKKQFIPTGDKQFVIVIASYNNKYWFQRNLDSVFNQTYENYRIIYVEDGSSDKTGELVENYIKDRGYQDKVTLIKNKERIGSPLASLYKAAALCKPEEIIVCLDGDDWFASDDVLKLLNKTYQDPDIWVTYGQFVYYPSNQHGWANQVPINIIEKNEFRDYHWITTHLRTFYAALFHKINKEDLLYNGKFYQMAGDLAFMFPIVEMAGKHSKFIPEVLYVYNTGTELNEDKVNRGLQTQLCTDIRCRKKYQPIKTLFEIPSIAKTIYIKPSPGSRLFDINDPVYNRDDCLRPFYDLRAAFEKHGYKLLQVESLDNLKDVAFIITQDIHKDQLNNLTKYPKEKLILFVWEPPSVLQNNYNKVFHDYYGNVITWSDDMLDQGTQETKYFKYHYPYLADMIRDTVSFENRKLCTLISANKNSDYENELYSERLNTINFFEDLGSYDFDFYGMFWDKSRFKNYKGTVPNKVNVMKNYKFCICYENTKNIRGYVTEKIFDCFKAGCVPVYWGAPNILEYIPEDCFINRTNFKSDMELYKFMQSMSKQTYENYLANIRSYLASQKAKLYSIDNFAKVFLDVCNIGN